MAPTFRHGRLTRIACNAVDLSPILNDSSVTHQADAMEATAYQALDRTYVAGLRRGDVSFSGMFDGSTAQAQSVLQSALGGTTAQVWTVCPEDSQIGRRTRMLQGQQTEFTITSPVADIVAIQGGTQPTGRVDYGVVVAGPSTALSSTGPLAASTHGTTAAATTFGAVGHLHIVPGQSSQENDALANVGSITCVIQHSSGSGWTDYITFTASTGATYERIESTAACKEQVRLNVSAYSTQAAVSTASNGAKVLCSFARRPSN